MKIRLFHSYETDKELFSPKPTLRDKLLREKEEEKQRKIDRICKEQYEKRHQSALEYCKAVINQERIKIYE